MADGMPAAATLIDRIHVDHMRELEEQLDLFAESQQSAKPFKQFADTIEFLLKRLKAALSTGHLAAQVLQEALSTKTTHYNRDTAQFEWHQSNSGAKLNDEETAQVEAHVDTFNQTQDLCYIDRLVASMKTTLNKAQKTADIPHRVVNHLQLTLKHDLKIDCRLSTNYRVTRVQLIDRYASYMKTCDTMLGILWDKSLTLALQHPSKRRRTE